MSVNKKRNMYFIAHIREKTKQCILKAIYWRVNVLRKLCLLIKRARTLKMEIFKKHNVAAIYVNTSVRIFDIKGRMES